jgi:transcriptional regulator with XRE-family HTH domain
MEHISKKHSVHQGQNIQKFRLIRNISQTDLADKLGEKQHKIVSQQLISDIEKREIIEDEELLKQIAEILKVDPEVIKNLDWDSAITIMGNTIHATSYDHSNSFNLPIYHNSTIRQHYYPIEKVIELFEKKEAELKAEIKKLRKEIEKGKN